MNDFTDVIPVLIAELRKLGYEAGVSTPEHYSDTPFVQVGQVDGGPEEFEFGDSPVVDITVYARGYTAARKAALQIRKQVMDFRATRLSGGFLLDRAQPTGPIWVENHNPEIHEFLLSFNFSYRTQNTHEVRSQ